MPKNHKHREILIEKAKEDLAAAKSLILLEEFSEEIVLFHCQQAIEKVLKAYLDSKQIIYPKIHDLETLLSMCIEKDNSFRQIEFVTELTPYAVEIRYDEFTPIIKEDLAKMISRTEEAFNFSINKIQI